MQWRKVSDDTWKPAGSYSSAAVHKVGESYRITFGPNAFIAGTIPTLKEAKEIVEKTIETMEAYEDESCCAD
jgi:hypothetical protein